MLLLALALCSAATIAAAGADAAPPGAVAAAAAERAAGVGSHGPAQVDRALNQLRLALAAAALGVWLLALRRGGPSQVHRIALGGIAALAFACNYNLFLWTGLHRHEFFHYYLGSKYFPELGYFRLYECSAEALRARGDPVVERATEMTDLRRKQRRPAAEVLSQAAPCRPDFSEARWQSFQDDLGAFLRILGPEGWLRVVRDHGYNPSPVWTLLGRPLAERVPPEPSALWHLARLDLWLLVAALAAVAWGFGFEAACLVAIAWGACGMTRYQWTGDAFLRQPWFAAMLAGLACIRRGRAALGGASLALSGLLRVFPLVAFAGLALVEARACVAARRWRPRPEALRIALGAAAAGLLLIGASTAVNGRGPAAWLEFAENMRVQTSFTPRNALGLRYVLGFTTEAPPAAVLATARSRAEAIEANKRLALERRRPLQVLALGLFAALFWRAARPPQPPSDGLEAWEAAALGFLAVPFLTLPGSYYLGFLTVAALLATRRPRIGAVLLAATAIFAASLVFAGGPWPYVWSSLALLLACLWMLVELRRPAPAPRLSPG